VPLNEDDIREILRLIDESDVAELRIETEGLSLHVLRGEPWEAEASPPVDARAGGGGGAAELVAVTASMVGTFYRAEAPGAAPFVEVGSRVEPATVVGLIEVMKMMNSVPAGVAGTIAEVCVENGGPVEYGATLFNVRPERA
jgi:acetyl-CoA carboxylase biotin carboxyl carrier protein